MGNRPTGTGFFEAETGLEKCQIRSVETLTFRLSVRNVRQNADYLSGSPPIGELREWVVVDAVALRTCLHGGNSLKTGKNTG